MNTLIIIIIKMNLNIHDAEIEDVLSLYKSLEEFKNDFKMILYNEKVTSKYFITVDRHK